MPGRFGAAYPLIHDGGLPHCSTRFEKSFQRFSDRVTSDGATVTLSEKNFSVNRQRLILAFIFLDGLVSIGTQKAHLGHSSQTASF